MLVAVSKLIGIRVANAETMAPARSRVVSPSVTAMIGTPRATTRSALPVHPQPPAGARPVHRVAPSLDRAVKCQATAFRRWRCRNALQSFRWSRSATDSIPAGYWPSSPACIAVAKDANCLRAQFFVVALLQRERGDRVAGPEIGDRHLPATNDTRRRLDADNDVLPLSALSVRILAVE